MKNYLKINEIASLFNIPVSTLHYWEKSGLFKVKRNEKNKYREYNISDILNIWEIMLYRELDIPVEEIKNVLQDNMDNLEAVYEEKEKKIQDEINELKERQKKIKQQKQLIQIVKELTKCPFRETVPDFSKCIVDHTEKETIEASLENPYNCIMHISDDSNRVYTRGICMEPKEKDEILWEKEDKMYVEFLLKMNIEDYRDNNLDEICEKIKQNGYQGKGIIARYLLVVTEEEKRVEYYRAWMEVV